MNNRISYRSCNYEIDDLANNDPPDRNKVIEAFENNKYSELSILISNFCLVDSQYGMLVYCVNNNDIELLDKLIAKYKNYAFLDDCQYYQDTITKCKNKDIIDRLFKIKNINFNEIKYLTENSIRYDNMYIMDKLHNIGYKLSYNDLATALFWGKIDYVNSIIHLYDNLQNIFNDNFEHFYNIMLFKLPIEKIKHIMSIGIDITNHLNAMALFSMKWMDDNDCVIFLHELGATNINKCIEKACESNNIILVEYFLQHGAILEIKENIFNFPKYRMIKLLLDYEHKFSDRVIKCILQRAIQNGDMDNIKKIFDEFDIVSLDFLFEYEKNNNIFSIIQYIISNNNIDVIKFIISYNDNNLDTNKLFIVASCNGNVEIAKLLLDVNNNVDYNLAFECACYFGQYDMVRYLLKYDVALNNNVIWMCVYGYSFNNIGYLKILEKCDMKNDTFVMRVNKKSDLYNGYNISNIVVLKILLELGLNLTIEMIREIEHINYDMIFIHNLIDNGCNINDLLKLCVGCRNTSNNMYPIVTYLLDNGGCVNVEDVKDIHMMVFLENYNDGYL